LTDVPQTDKHNETNSVKESSKNHWKDWTELIWTQLDDTFHDHLYNGTQSPGSNWV